MLFSGMNGLCMKERAMKLLISIASAAISLILLTADAVWAQRDTLLADNAALIADYPPSNTVKSDEVESMLYRNRLDMGGWTVSADLLAYGRGGGKAFPLVTRSGSNAELLNAKDFSFPTSYGPRLAILGEDLFMGMDFEAVYFSFDGFSAGQSTSDPAGMNYMLFGSPTPVSPGAEVSYYYVSRLHNVELNLRHPLCNNLSWLVGGRYVDLHEDLNSTILGVPSAQANTDNHLYGFQIGLDGSLSMRQRYCIEAVVKAGVFNNYTDVLFTGANPSNLGDRTQHLAFVGEVGLMSHCMLTDHLSVRAGYEVMWIDGVSLAGDQFESLNPANPKPHVGGTLFYHGALAGMEFSF
jgi:hypothetical protein